MRAPATSSSTASTPRRSLVHRRRARTRGPRRGAAHVRAAPPRRLRSRSTSVQLYPHLSGIRGPRARVRGVSRYHRLLQHPPRRGLDRRATLDASASYRGDESGRRRSAGGHPRGRQRDATADQAPTSRASSHGAVMARRPARAGIYGSRAHAAARGRLRRHDLSHRLRERAAAARGRGRERRHAARLHCHLGSLPERRAQLELLAGFIRAGSAGRAS